MAKVVISAAALKKVNDLPASIRARINGIVQRLEAWPDVSGYKALRGDRFGSFRIRTGDYRIIFTVSGDGATVTITKVGHRREVYD